TRSGLLGESSVHSFAEMNRFALWILAAILFASIAVLAGFWFTAGLRMAREASPPREGIDRETGYSAGLLLLSLVGTVAALGMGWSFFSAILTGRAASVDPHLYQVSLVWIFVPLVLLLAIVPFLGWREESLSKLWNRLANSFGISLGVTGIM